MYTPFTQCAIWADINKYHNKLEPIVINSSGVSCLFGFDLVAKTMTSFNGPVVSTDTSAKEFVNFLKKVLDTAKNRAVTQIYFRTLPPLRKYGINLEAEFLKLGFRQHEWKTLIIDLNSSEEDIRSNFAHSARKAIKKAIAMGVRIELCDTFESFYSNFLVPYIKTTNRELKPKNFYEHSWDLATDDIYSYWVAKSKENEILGFLGTYRYDSIATEIMSALTSMAFEQKIPAQDLLHWEIIKYHKKLGDSYFDLAGFNPNPVTEKEINIHRFKEKWGGMDYDCSSYSLDTRSFMHKLMIKIKNSIHV